MSLERITDSDVLYHDVEYRLTVTLARQEFLLSKHFREC